MINRKFIKIAPETIKFQGTFFPERSHAYRLLGESLSQSEHLFIRKSTRAKVYREIMIFRRIEKAI